MTAAVQFSVVCSADCLPVAHLHVDGHVVLLKHVVILILELIVVHDAHKFSMGLLSYWYLPLVWKDGLGPGTGWAGTKRTGSQDSSQVCVAPCPFGFFQKEEPAPLCAFFIKFPCTRQQIKLVILVTNGTFVLTFVSRCLLVRDIAHNHDKRDVEGGSSFLSNL